MNAYYFVLWIPQTRKESPKIIKNQLDPKNLCDIETLPSFNVRGSISIAKDILLEYSIGDESFDKKLEFKFIESDNRGFVIYKLELEDQQNDFLCKLLRKEMPNAIYHYFKSFYHKHVFHEESEDSLLSAYFSPVPIKWDDKKVQSKILESLLDDYITKFEGAYELYSPRYIEIATNLNNRKGIDRQINELKKLIIECREKYNEHLYSDFLLATFPDIKATKKRELENVIKVFETLIMNQESALSQAYAEAGFGYSVGGYYVGVSGLLVGAISVIVSLVSTTYSVRDSRIQSQETSAEFKKYKDEIRITMDSIKEKEQCVLEELNRVENKVNTLNDNIRNQKRKSKTK